MSSETILRASSQIPGRYIDRPEPAQLEQPISRKDAGDIEVQEDGDFSPLGHSLRR